MAGPRPPVGSFLDLILGAPTGRVLAEGRRKGYERSRAGSVAGADQERTRRPSRGHRLNVITSGAVSPLCVLSGVNRFCLLTVEEVV